MRRSNVLKPVSTIEFLSPKATNIKAWGQMSRANETLGVGREKFAVPEGDEHRRNIVRHRWRRENSLDVHLGFRPDSSGLHPRL